MSYDWSEWHKELAAAFKDGVPANFLSHPRVSETMVFGGSHETNLEHQRLHVMAWIGLCGQVPAGSVVEFGGGYGAMRSLFPRNADYTIVDHPACHAMQRRYLDDAYTTTFVSSLDECPATPSLFIAMWSVTELPWTMQSEWLSYSDKAGRVLVGYKQGDLAPGLHGACHARIRRLDHMGSHFYAMR